MNPFFSVHYIDIEGNEVYSIIQAKNATQAKKRWEKLWHNIPKIVKIVQVTS
jgi:hypothetical protein